MNILLKRQILSSFLIFSILYSPIQSVFAQKSAHITGKDDLFKLITVTEGLEHPWGMVFLPDKRLLVTERPGRLRIIHNGQLDPKPVTGLPDIKASGQGGLLDIALHPDYEQNQWIYFSYVSENHNGMGTEVARAKLIGKKLTELQVIFTLAEKSDTSRHFGGRLLFDKAHYLYISIGDRGNRPRAQKLSDHAGSMIRLHDNGRIPADNPYVSRQGIKPEIFSYGHRNPQGIALHPETGEIWSHEHGPQGGDELNLIKKGLNYGWPVITYGVNYGIGTKIGEGTHKSGMQQPIYYWVPSIAPSGFTFYTGNKFPGWKNNLLVGSLKFQQLVRLKLKGKNIVYEERFLTRKLGRIRDVKTGPDGYIYILTDARNGKLIRLEPKQ